MDLIIDLPITSLLPVLLLLFFPLLCFLLLRHASPRRRLPPSPPSLPLIGHLHHLLSSPSPPHHVFARLAAGLNTDILLLRLGRVPTLVYGEVVNAATGLRGRLERNLADLRAVCDEIIREHEEAAAGGDGGGEEREDFVDVLLKVQKGGGLEVPITDDNLKALVLDMFVAGTDTTSATLEWVMTELARHPPVLHKAQAEVRAAAAAAAAAAAGRRDKGKSTVDEVDLPRLRYVKAVVKEALRVHPPVPLLVPRESVGACSVGGYAVPAKTRVLVNTYAIGKDPRVWENPLEFRPERFVSAGDDDDDVKKGALPPQQDFRLLPFGGGRRGCPGYTFALATVELALAKLLFHFDWRLPEGVQPEDVDLDEVFGLATRKKTPLVLVATVNPEHATLPNTAGPSSQYSE